MLSAMNVIVSLIKFYIQGNQLLSAHPSILASKIIYIVRPFATLYGGDGSNTLCVCMQLATGRAAAARRSGASGEATRLIRVRDGLGGRA